MLELSSTKEEGADSAWTEFLLTGSVCVMLELSSTKEERTGMWEYLSIEDEEVGSTIVKISCTPGKG